MGSCDWAQKTGVDVYRQVEVLSSGAWTTCRASLLEISEKGVFVFLVSVRQNKRTISALRSPKSVNGN